MFIILVVLGPLRRFGFIFVYLVKLSAFLTRHVCVLSFQKSTSNTTSSIISHHRRVLCAASIDFWCCYMKIACYRYLTSASSRLPVCFQVFYYLSAALLLRCIPFQFLSYCLSPLPSRGVTISFVFFLNKTKLIVSHG